MVLQCQRAESLSRSLLTRLTASACLVFSLLYWATVVRHRSWQQLLTVPMLTNTTTVVAWISCGVAGVFLLWYGAKPLLLSQQGPLQLLLGFAASQPCCVPQGVSAATSLNGIAKPPALTVSTDGMGRSTTSDPGGALSYGFNISKAVQEMLQNSTSGAMQLLWPAWTQSPTGRSTGLNFRAALSAAPRGFPRFGAVEPTATSICSTPSKTNSSHSSAMRSTESRDTSTRFSQRLSCDLLQKLTARGGTSSVQAYSEVPEHAGAVLVLYVDKNPIDQAVVAMMLGSKGHNARNFKLVSARCGREALDMVLSSSYLPDLVLLDTMLPDIKASEVCRVLRVNFSPLDLPIMLVTGHSGELDALAALDKGVNDFIIKPLRQAELMARISSQLMVKQSVKREADSRCHYDLLVQVLPPHIITRLAQGQAYTPEQHEQVTILFSDIVGFTEICSRWTTQQVVTMLDLIFSSFDDLCDKHNVFKVETIGDAYMVVSGHDACEDHALRMAAMAVDMLDAVKGLEQQLGTVVRVRIGMHTGPALSGVVGKCRPRYCFFGDTVNTASRMESTGYPMTIHISDACKHSMITAAATTPSACAVQRRPAPITISQSSIHTISEFFLPTTPKQQKAAASQGAPASPRRPSKASLELIMHPNGNSGSAVSPSGSPRSNLGRANLSSAPQQGTASTADAVGPIRRLQLNSNKVVAAVPAVAAAAEEALPIGGHEACHSRADGLAGMTVAPNRPTVCRKAATEGQQAEEAETGINLASVDECIHGLPWKLVDLGYADVKGKGSMKTHLLKVGEWHQGLIAVRAGHAAAAEADEEAPTHQITL